MHCVKKIKEDLYWVGGNDRRLALFENMFPIPRGVSYNSYVLSDEKTVLLDTVDKSVSGQFFENVEYALNGRSLDYLIVNHTEPDHAATIGEVVLRYPDVKLVANAKTVNMIKQFFNFDVDSRTLIVKEGDTLNTGKHTLTFVFAPMVHWPFKIYNNGKEILRPMLKQVVTEESSVVIPENNSHCEPLA